MNKKSYDALSIPPGGRQEGGTEVLRAGITTSTNLTVSLRPALSDPTMWGVLLASVARQVAAIYAQDRGESAATIGARICDKFNEEMASPDDPGELVRVR